MHFMRNFLTFIKEFKIPKRKELLDALNSFSRKEVYVFTVFVLASLVSMVILVGKVNSAFIVEVPERGGQITEGIIGMPTLVNPVLSLSDADKDITTLVYSGLMRKMPDGTFAPDLAKSFEVSPDGMTYTFILKKNAKFQDGTKVTPEDIIFTIDKIKDPLIKSPRKLSWDGVTVSKKDDDTVVFTLKQPFISFLDNTTIGILPSHVWKNTSVQEFGLSNLNIKAIGSGPYSIDSVSKNEEGVPEEYKLKRFDEFALGKPNIKYVNIISYANEKELLKALASHAIDQASGISPENASIVKSEGYTIHTAILPRMFGLFFNNANNKNLADKSVINAFNKALNRQELIDKILYGYGTPSYNPIPESLIKGSNSSYSLDNNIEEAKSLLSKSGWNEGPDGVRTKGGVSTVTKTKKVGKKTVTETVKVNNGPVVRLSFSITTGDTPELKDAAILIKEQLSKVGAEVEIKVYEPGPLNQIIRTRDYEALFFGQIINHESDLYSFWHSSQKTDPGLNIAMYSNKNVDAILESAQKTQDPNSRINKYMDFIKEFNSDIPALLIYSPKYLYATNPKLNNMKTNILTNPSDRLLSIYDWYSETDKVWKIFSNSATGGTTK